MGRLITYKIKKEDENKNIEQYLLERFYNEKIIQYFTKKTSHLTINNQKVDIQYNLKKNDLLSLYYENDNKPAYYKPYNLPLEVLYQDDDIMVVNKPAGLLSHPSIDNNETTLPNVLANYWQKRHFVYYCTSRLDGQTSGLMVIAKNKLAATILNEMVLKKVISKKYYALVEGKFKKEDGIINAPIARKNEKEIKRIVSFTKGKEATTLYHVLKYNKEKNISLLDVTILNGRTHQIRVHMKYKKHPLVGDQLYNSENKMMTHQALQAYCLQLLHPITLKPLKFEVKLDKDIANTLKNNCK